MADDNPKHNAKQAMEGSAEATAENAKELSHDFVEYVKAYARENPGTAALWCFGIGFVVGWKMKPW